MITDDTPCLILEWTGAAAWPALDHLPQLAGGRPQMKIPPGCLYGALQPNRASAEAEAKRLAAAYPDRQFAVFAACSVAQMVVVPSSITRDGETWGQRNIPVVLAMDDSQIPY